MPEQSSIPFGASFSHSTNPAATHSHAQLDLDQLHSTLRSLFDLMLQHAAAERAHIDSINSKNAERARRRARPYWWGPVQSPRGDHLGWYDPALRCSWSLAHTTALLLLLELNRFGVLGVLDHPRAPGLSGMLDRHPHPPRPISFYIWYRWEEQDISDERAVGVLVILFAMLAYLIGEIQSSNDGLSEAFGSGC